jgi:hypothetical protein
VAAVGEVGQGLTAEQAEKGLMDQGTGLEGVPGSLVAHEVAGDAPQLAVDGADEAVLGPLFAGSGRLKERGQVVLRVAAHRHLLRIALEFG